MIAGGLRSALAGEAWRRRLRRALALLAEQRATLRGGRLAELAALTPRVEAALEALVQTPPPQGAAAERDLQALREAAARNAALLEAVREGAAEARRSAQAMREAGGRLGYDRKGALMSARGDGGRRRA